MLHKVFVIIFVSILYQNLCANVLRIVSVLHIHYLMTCSEYVVSDDHTNIYLTMIACGIYLRKFF